MSEKAVRLQKELKALSFGYIQNFISNNNSFQSDEFFTKDCLVKAICRSGKFSIIESAVDLFFVFLFERLGFYSDRLFTMP